MSKISQYASDTSPSLTDYLIGVEASGPTTKRYVLSDLLTLFLNNIPATEGSLAFVSSGLVWSGDAYASTRAASMTSGRIRVNTTFLAIAAVTARIFTASKDTYIDVLDNLDGSGTLVYTEVTNNAASPALASNSTRIGIIVTGATTIAAAGSVNQGEETKVLPIASSVAYSVTDSLGNLICPRDPNRKLLSQRQITTNFSTASTTVVQVTGLTCPVIIPAARKINLKFFVGQASNSSAGFSTVGEVWDGTVGSGTRLQISQAASSLANNPEAVNPEVTYTPASTTKTYNAGLYTNGGGTSTANSAGTGQPVFLRVEL